MPSHMHLPGELSDHQIEALLEPTHLYSRVEALSKPSPIPRSSGVYAWYFREVPPDVPIDACHSYNGLPLLYVGISPKKPPSNGEPPSTQNLYKRIRYHFGGNAAGSTLRLTLGCLLAEKLDIKLRLVGSGGRYTLTNPGEIKLDNWLNENALVCWIENPEPWKLEHQLIQTLSLPLNIDGNNQHPFCSILRSRRVAARIAADAAECLADSGGPRRPQIVKGFGN